MLATWWQSCYRVRDWLSDSRSAFSVALEEHVNAMLRGEDVPKALAAIEIIGVMPPRGVSTHARQRTWRGSATRWSCVYRPWAWRCSTTWGRRSVMPPCSSSRQSRLVCCRLCGAFADLRRTVVVRAPQQPPHHAVALDAARRQRVLARHGTALHRSTLKLCSGQGGRAAHDQPVSVPRAGPRAERECPRVLLQVQEPLL